MVQVLHLNHFWGNVTQNYPIFHLQYKTPSSLLAVTVEQGGCWWATRRRWLRWVGPAALQEVISRPLGTRCCVSGQILLSLQPKCSGCLWRRDEWGVRDDRKGTKDTKRQYTTENSSAVQWQWGWSVRWNMKMKWRSALAVVFFLFSCTKSLTTMNQHAVSLRALT